MVLKPEFEGCLRYPPTTGFIEFVAVRRAYRRRGIASLLLRESMEQSAYEDFVLDVINENTPARCCYEKRNGYTKTFMRCNRQIVIDLQSPIAF